MAVPDTLYESNISSLPLIAKGKVRELYALNDHEMLIVTTDRISAFDVILPTPIPGKGVVLTAVSNFWFDRTAGIVKNHRTNLTLECALPDEKERAQVTGRAMIVKRLKALPIEAIVRGYLVGSGWKDYQATGAISGHQLPTGMQVADPLPEPIYTPSTKAELGEHDANIDFAATVELVGADMAAQVRDVSLKLYTEARDYAAGHGIIIADTKFEFGLDENGQLVLIDEVLTPDSSRFWPADQYAPGANPPSFDKQYVRDYLETLDWDKTAPGPKLPSEVIQNTASKYREAQTRLMQTH
ncbi:MAG TPA: phosphoribosylaminoimidazolesuccinocarboxamide synthase [Chromatiaceae bacterium]|jgi:phosphoribosylaminoimidazole-succinocarboxamide synthase|nr:phosphoribosylaminoimidazolesuccinocarboxamide synthase [Chromatiaceae bacterium]HIB83155.1 phosphoribosylaminoimidazolesuccinocarboxamide synthase [Chromatiaceae bacterium]HIN82255.1 phosphoribosylaminoimidazolesuccinocarboxamide synthase [Chromatiales bacterium]HIO13587.1 phosphoribosylaminoimidazolesuccinocarboxamide synthase [Chromatiales bacterium]HIO54044.1 phosphoribosylaminoimidazolesuccinocarboxamide synthase [Chromatiales bacterium]